MFKMFKSKKGFTMLELVTVIALIGVMMAVLMPKAAGAKDQMKIAVDKQSIAMINECIALHTAVNGYTDLAGQTSMSVVQPIKNGDSVDVIVRYLKDKGMLDEKAQVFYSQGHSYSVVSNEVN